MFSESVIEHGIIQAYADTNYIVHANSQITLRIGIFSPALAELHKTSGIDCSVFITAWNPFSRAVDDQINDTRQAMLNQDLLDLGVAFYEGIGQHTSGNWPGEKSFLALGVSLDTAKNLGIRYEQNAILWCGSDATSHLILLR